ncbi:MAG TPA: NAD(P)/FAD-dependent oxidoreductase [Solirubrobacterales bacterium]|nr:NAD(P)/FAD-dependent oxidoreductase [Solirubrobacterales bacterium]
MSEAPHRVAVIGGGFGGLEAAKHLAAAPVEVTLIDRRNFHLFQPLSYQVATGALSPAEVCYPLRAIFKGKPNVRVVMATVEAVDLGERKLRLAPSAEGGEEFEVDYDTLVVAAGSSYSYFGHEEWRRFAPEVKSLESALELRARLLGAFEAAELEADAERRCALLTFVVVGGGPTGVEMAGQIAELARDTLSDEFRTIDPSEARVLLVEMTDRVLTTFPPSLSRKAKSQLEHLGVTTLLGHTVVGIDAESVTVEGGGEAARRIPAHNVIWAAGVTASALGGALAEQCGGEVDKAGRILVEPDLTVPGNPAVFAIGDMIRVRRRNGEAQVLPGVAPVAMQQGRYVAKAVRARLEGRSVSPFHYLDKGNLATIGRARAVADLHFLRLSGFPAWLTWLFVHLWYLIGFQNRLLVFVRWSFSFLTRGRGARVIAEGGEERESGQAG